MREGAADPAYGAALSFALGKWVCDGFMNSSVVILKRSSAKRLSRNIVVMGVVVRRIHARSRKESIILLISGCCRFFTLSQCF